MPKLLTPFVISAIFSMLLSCQPSAPTITEAIFPKNTRDPYGPYFVNAKVEGSVHSVYLWVEGVTAVESISQAVFLPQDASILDSTDFGLNADEPDALPLDQGTNLGLKALEKKKISMQKMGALWVGQFEGFAQNVEYRLQIEAVGEGGSRFYPTTPQSFTVTLASLDCLVDQDCLSFEICDRDRFICRPKSQSCDQDRDCPIDQKCDQNTKICVYRDDLCQSDTDCSSGYRCEQRSCISICNPPCTADQKCISIPPNLDDALLDNDQSTHLCIANEQPWCTSNLSCLPEQQCNLQTGQCEQLKCSSSEECIGILGEGFECLTGLCAASNLNQLQSINDILTYFCNACLSEVDCRSEQLGCSANGYCRLKCLNDEDCQAGEYESGKFYCDLSSNTCIEAFPIYPDLCTYTNGCLGIFDCVNGSLCISGKCVTSSACVDDLGCGEDQYCLYETCIPNLYCDNSTIYCGINMECINNRCEPIDFNKNSCDQICSSSLDCEYNEFCSIISSFDGLQKTCVEPCDPSQNICGIDHSCQAMVGNIFVCLPFNGYCDIEETICPSDITEPNDFGYQIDMSGLTASVNASLCPSSDIDVFNIINGKNTLVEIYPDQALDVYVDYLDMSTGLYRTFEQRVEVNLGFLMGFENLTNIRIAQTDSSLLVSNYTLKLSEQTPFMECIDDSLEPNDGFDNPSVFGNGAFLSLVSCIDNVDYLRLSRRVRGDGFVEFQNQSFTGSLYIDLYFNGNLYQSFELVDFLSIPISSGRMDEWLFVIQNLNTPSGISYTLNSRF